jgi:hypothetical protein
MKIREVLQTELWSKRTTWKILIVSAVVLVLGYGFWQAYDRYWISLGVRGPGRMALAQIDELQTTSKSCDPSFDAKAEGADREIKLADPKAHTTRDFAVTMQLTVYLGNIQLKHLRDCGRDAGEQKSARLRGFVDRLLGSTPSLKQELHRELD